MVEARGCEPVEVTDEDINEELLLLIRAGMAGAESRKISERVVANRARIVSGGTHSRRKYYLRKKPVMWLWWYCPPGLVPKRR